MGTGPKIPADSYLLLIGAMKCGTSSLFSMLAGLDEICGSRVKEPEYFSQHQAHKVSVDSYESLWDFNLTRHRYALEASTGYTKYPTERDVPERILDYGLKPKFIYLVRNPFERIESQYNFLKHDREHRRRGILNEEALAISDYFMQAEMYARVFGRERLCVLDLDDVMRGIPPGLFSFLKISPRVVAPVAENVTAVNSEAVDFVRWADVAGMASMAPAGLKKAGVLCLSKLVKPRRSRLSPIQREIVHDKLCDSMARLREEYGINTRKWGF